METGNVKIEEQLKKLRLPFSDNEIKKLPKPTKKQTECPASEKIYCNVCGGWHHPRVKHVDYVGHAALTNRLLDVDLFWNWVPFAIDEDGFPKLDKNGGLWVRLTVCGITRPGYGTAPGKTGPDVMKELIGDSLRNAAMRFGAALELWHKGDFDVDESDYDKKQEKQKKQEQVKMYPQEDFDKNINIWLQLIQSGKQTPDHIISIIESKGSKLTDEMKTKIKDGSNENT